jgi:hypothetical protein
MDQETQTHQEEAPVTVQMIMDAIERFKNTEHRLLTAFDDLTERYYIMEAENIKLKALLANPRIVDKGSDN